MGQRAEAFKNLDEDADITFVPRLSEEVESLPEMRAPLDEA
jgi:hypothetical protein